MEKNTDINNANDLMQYIKNNKFNIYGTGYISNRFYKMLSDYNITKNISNFYETKTPPNKEFYGKKVMSIDELATNSDLICLAVHETNKSDIEKELKMRNIKKYIWIYPYLIPLFLGEPIKRNISIPMSNIVKNCIDYRLAIRYLAIEQYYEKNDIGYDLYIRAHSLNSNKDTSENRLKNFISLIENWDINGYNNKDLISIDEKYKLIDGTHRMALAIYHGMKSIECNIFNSSDNWESWMGKNGLMTKDVFSKTNFNDRELTLIENTYREIKFKYL